MVLDLKRRLQVATGQTLAATVAFDHPTIHALAAHLAEQLLPTLPGDVPRPPIATTHDPQGWDEVKADDLDEQDAVEALEQELKAVRGMLEK
jgi:hypothetical protein